MRFWKKPVEVEATPFNGFNKNEIKVFTQGNCYLDVTNRGTPAL